MKNVMGIIHHLKRQDSLQEITKHRCIASVPFGGRYRLVDFVLSNMVNTGMSNIGIITDLQLRSLVDHLGKGKEWGLDRKNDGLFILPSATTKSCDNERKVDLEDLYVNMDYIQRSKQEYVILAGSNLICNMDLKEVYDYHLDKSSDITLIYREQIGEGKKSSSSFLLETTVGERVKKIWNEGVVVKKHKESLDIYLLKKDLLLHILAECFSHNKWDLIGDYLFERTKDLKIYGYNYKGYAAIINTVDDYFTRQMELLSPQIWREVFYKKGPVHTKFKDGPPTKYCGTSLVKNTLVANGCIIEGKVENSILFRGVRVSKGAHIKNSIIMSDSRIEGDAYLDRVILDKNVYIRQGAMLVGEEEQPVVVEKKSVI